MQKKQVIFTMLVAALMCFEIVNYSTTVMALNGIWGTIRVSFLTLSQLMAIASCLVDLAGTVRIFTIEESLRKESRAVIVAMSGWLIAATLNATLTWFSVISAMQGIQPVGPIPKETLIAVFPVSIALLLWLIRISLVGAIGEMGEGMFRKRAPTSKVRPKSKFYVGEKNERVSSGSNSNDTGRTNWLGDSYRTELPGSENGTGEVRPHEQGRRRHYPLRGTTWGQPRLERRREESLRDQYD